MDAKTLDVAAEFCKLVGFPNLLAYLGVPETVEPDESRGKLKSRRKYMQGMQGNPKFRAEALFLIKHFAALNELLGDTAAYMADARRRAESEHLPVLEMTIRGVLAGGSLTAEQEEYLLHNAVQLGVSENTFHDVLARIGKEMNVPVIRGVLTPSPAPGRARPTDLYALLGVSHNAADDDIRTAFQRRMEEAERLRDPTAAAELRKRLDIARTVLSNTSARRHYDLTQARTGPPARSREIGPPAPGLRSAPTAPPVRRDLEPTAVPASVGVGPRLEILGDPVRSLRIPGAREVIEVITLRNGGDGRMTGSVTADVPWVRVEPGRLAPEAVEQQVTCHVDGASVPENATSVVVTIETEHGERARVVFELQRGTDPRIIAGVVAGVVVVAIVIAAIAFALT